jgi:alcohol dehydrogenase class IV
MISGSYEPCPIERISWGRPAAEVVAEEAERSGAMRVFAVASSSVAPNLAIMDPFEAALGARWAGQYDGSRQHTPLSSVLACADAVRGAAPDLILTIGGGSPVDMVKLVQLCLIHDIRSEQALLDIAGTTTRQPSPVRQIVVPTTLSGGEFTNSAGGTDMVRKTKPVWYGTDLCAKNIVYDPALSLHTPEWLWLSTAIRSLDHAIEGYCSPRTSALVQANALHAMRLYADSLRATRHDPENLEARHSSQMAAWLATTGLGHVPMGASHGMGYLIGSMFDIPHGQTSCVLLAAVLQWNAQANGDADGQIAAALGMPGASASEALAALLVDLGLPQRLSDVGIGRDDLSVIAERTIAYSVSQANPRPVVTAGDVMEILDIAL